MNEEKRHALTEQDLVLTEQERHVLEHTLTGQTGANRSREAYRNFYAAGKGHHAMPQLESLVARGLMKVGVKYGDDGNYYQCTESGATAVGIALPLYYGARRRVVPATTTENKIGVDNPTLDGKPSTHVTDRIQPGQQAHEFHDRERHPGSG